MNAPPSIRRRPFYALFAAQVVAMFGNSLTGIAIPWFVLETTGSAARTGIVAAAGLVPVILATAIGGAAVDRVGFRRMSVVSDLLSMVTVAMIPLLYHTVGLDFGVLLALIFLGALFDTPGGSAKGSMQPDLARDAGLTLERANAMSQGANSLSGFAGPVIAGLLIPFVGASNLLWFNAGTFAISIVAMVSFVPYVQQRHGTVAATSYLDDVRAGWSYLIGHRLIRSIAVTATIINFVLTPMIVVLLPVYVSESGDDASVFGWIVASFSLGSLLGVIVYGAIGHGWPRRPVLAGTFMVAVIPLAAFAILPPWPVAVAAGFVLGLLLAPTNPMISTIMQEQVPTELRGRVFGAVIAIAMVASPAGVVVAGFLVEGIGLAAAFALIAATIGGVSLWMLLNPALRDMAPPDAVDIEPRTPERAAPASEPARS